MAGCGAILRWRRTSGRVNSVASPRERRDGVPAHVRTEEDEEEMGESYGTKGGSCLRCILGDNEEDDVGKVVRRSRVQKFQMNN